MLDWLFRFCVSLKRRTCKRYKSTENGRSKWRIAFSSAVVTGTIVCVCVCVCVCLCVYGVTGSLLDSGKSALACINVRSAEDLKEWRGRIMWWYAEVEKLSFL
jgi:hypothetical protein